MPRVRLDGGVIGSLNTPSTTLASGMWTIKDNEEYTRRGLWPSQGYPVGGINAIALVVAGGGGGGGQSGGGGGAGGLIYNSNFQLSTGLNYTTTIGAGGAGGISTTSFASNGTNTSFVGGTVSYTAVGGGAGGNYNGVSSVSGATGGSGGGGPGTGTGQAKSPGGNTLGQGYAGGTGFSLDGSGSGGGGGGSANVGGAAASATGGPGGVGTGFNFANGTSVYYAGGGGGGATTTIGSVSSTANGGGSAGSLTNATNAANNTGGGGGGGGNGVYTGGSGGSGTIIVSYPLPQYFTGGIVTNNNGANVVHTFNTSGSLTALATPIDTYQPYNTILLHADGTNGANNSVFLDSSSNTFIPFNGTYSNYFNGTNGYLSVPSTNISSNDFTIEGWFYKTGASWASTTCGVVEQTASGSLSFFLSNNGTIRSGPQVQSSYSLGSTTSLNVNTWYHIAFTRKSGSTRVYVNGSPLQAATADSNNYNASVFTVGGNGSDGYFGGYISNVRIVNGTAVYDPASASITVPTVPLTAITNTRLLTAQSSAIIDNSGNNLTLSNAGPVVSVAGGNPITTQGSTTQGALSPFSTTGWSTYHPSASDYYSFPSLANMVLGASGNATIECWAYFSAIPASGSYILTKDGKAGTNVSEYSFQFSNGSGLLAFTVGDATGASSQQYISIGTITTGSWYHFAASRVGTTWYVFLNGTLVNSGGTAQTVAPVSGSRSFLIGGQQSNGNSLNGAYISNIRVIVGSALYTASFTPPIAALTNITNTVVLAAQSNRFADLISAGTITVAGAPQVQPFSPFNPTAAYSNTVGGSIQNGTTTSDGLVLSAYNASTCRFTGDFTAECWFYMNNITGTQTIFTHRTTAYVPILVWVASGTLTLYMSSAGASWDIISGQSLGTVTAGQWYHYALVRSGTSIKSYLNGAVVGAGATSGATLDSSTLPFRVGCTTNTAEYFNGFISNVRMVNGTAVYTSAFTPPTAPLTAVANTTLLLNTTNAGIIDNTQKINLISYGNAAISTTLSQYGGSSVFLGGSTNIGYLRSPNNPLLDLSTGAPNFTVECWFNTSNSNARGPIISKDFVQGTKNASYAFYIDTNNILSYIIADATGAVSYNIYSYTGIANNTWYHAALVRNGNIMLSFLNGNLVNTQNITITTKDGGASFDIGTTDNNAAYFTGYIDEVRITKGYARYTANFTPQTTSFLNT
jgi:hypothetical protein